MADFNVDLEAPKGQGASVISPVQEQVAPYSPNPLLKEVANIFANGLETTRKQAAQERKAAIVGEYVKNEQVYSDALTTGQWNASMVGTASRANFTKMLAAYPEYATELTEAKRAIYDATEIGQAQREVDDQKKLRNADKERASAQGFTFFEGISPESEDKIINASKVQTRVEQETAERYKASAEARAARAEGREVQKHNITMAEYQNKQETIKGLVEIADKNFDALGSMAKDLFNNASMSFEQKQLVFGENVRRVKAGLTAIGASNPELAAPFARLIDDMDNSFQKIADPKAKSANELAMLKAEFDSRMYKAKLLITSNEKARNAVAISDLFGNNPSLLDLATSPVLVSTLAQFGLGPDSGTTPTQVVGTPDEKSALKTIKGALNIMQKDSAVGDKPRMETEAVNTVNEVLRQNSTMQGPISAPMLKDLSAFYSSPEFGKLAEKGQLNMETMQNAKKVFQVSYEPVVIDAVQSRLTQQIQRSPGRDMGKGLSKPQTILETVNIRFNGSGVSIENKPNAKDTFASESTKEALKESEAGLNTLIRMGAHLEGTTDYAKYWETNKHLLLPAVFPDPAKLKPGQVVEGYKYLGGAYSDRSNWERVK